MHEEMKLWWVVAFALRLEALSWCVSWKVCAVQMLPGGIFQRPFSRYSSLKFGTVFNILN